MMKDHEFVSWMADRMVHVYGESPNVDFVHRARAIAENIARYDTAADNCEVLRARLAKYEDAEGNPISTIAEQAREIASKQATINGMNEAHWKVVQELAALKAQPKE